MYIVHCTSIIHIKDNGKLSIIKLRLCITLLSRFHVRRSSFTMLISFRTSYRLLLVFFIYDGDGIIISSSAHHHIVANGHASPYN